MNEFTIKDLENLSGIKAHTLRIWEQRYQILKPRRTPTNIRYYNNEELKTVLNIALLNKYGYKISHIGKMPGEEIKERILTLGDPRAVQERILNELVQEMVEMNIERFEEVLDQYIASRGIEKTVIQIIFPFLEKIGILWQTGHVNPAQEHLVSNLIRQKIILAIETTRSTVQSSKTFLLFLPEGEHRELGLLFMNYLLKSRGIPTIYLGANVPIADIGELAAIKNPDVFFVHLTALGSNFHFEKYLHDLADRYPKPRIIISGAVTQHYKKKIPANVSLKKSLGEVMEFLSSI